MCAVLSTQILLVLKSCYCDRFSEKNNYDATYSRRTLYHVKGKKSARQVNETPRTVILVIFAMHTGIQSPLRQPLSSGRWKYGSHAPYYGENDVQATLKGC